MIWGLSKIVTIVGVCSPPVISTVYLGIQGHIFQPLIIGVASRDFGLIPHIVPEQ